jgi:hypothetical protein
MALPLLQVDPGRSFDEMDVVLPPPAQRADICCMDLTAHFLVTGTRSGLISCHTVGQQPVAVNEYRHEGGGVLSLYAQPGGARLVFQDEQQAVMMLNQVRGCHGSTLTTAPLQLCQQHLLPGPSGQQPGTIWVL